MRIRVNKEIPSFVMIERAILLDPALSLEAKGLYAYIIASGEAVRSDTTTLAMQELLERGHIEQGYET